MVAGREVTPNDAAATERLMRYWTVGPGGERIRWGEPHDFYRCVAELSEHVDPNIVHGLCSNLHQRATGARPGHAASEQRSRLNPQEITDNEFVEESAVNTKSMGRVEIKDADQGVVSAVFATLNQIDSDGDVTLPGAFQEGAPVRISAYGHQSWQGALPVGKGTIRTVGNEAILDGQFFMNTQHGRDTFEVVKQLGTQQEWSYGYDPVKFRHGEFEGKSVRFLEEQKVHEVSPVLLGAGIGTRLLSAKTLKERLLVDRALKDAGIDPDAALKKVQQTKGIPAHATPVVSSPWDAVATVKALAENERPSSLRSIYAWCDPDGDPEKKSSYLLPHHDGVDGPANLRAVVAGIAALNSPDCGVPESDRKAAHEHLAAHMRDADMDPLELRSGPVSALKFFDHGASVLAAVSALVDRASEVMALRATKGKGFSPASADLLSWIEDETVRLKTLLAPPPPAVKEADLRDDEYSTLMAAVASVQGYRRAI